MRVVNRKGEYETMDFNAISERIGQAKETSGCKHVDHALVTQKVIQQMRDEMTTRDLDRLCADVCVQLATTDPAYGTLAARIDISSLHRDVRHSFAEVTEALYESGMLSDSYYQDTRILGDAIVKMIDYKRDYLFDLFGFRTLQKGYLLGVSERCRERPQDMWMRVAIQLWGTDAWRVQETYDALSTLTCIHATPTLFNAGTRRPQLASCFLMGTEDAIEGIFKTVSDAALISKWSGGLGLHVNNIRARGAKIHGTGGKATGLIPQLRVYNNVMRYIDQGGKRLGSMAIYLSPDHADYAEFLDLRKNHGDPELRCRDLFLASWIPDLFMERVEADLPWSMFSPDTAPGLDDVYGDAYRRLYEQYEREGKAIKTVPARQLWNHQIQCMIETGTPYVLFKDAINRKSNQQHYGTIKSSNLCSEIVEYSDAQETAVCNLGSVSLSKCVSEDGKFDFDLLYKTTRLMIRNLNRVIDVMYYPTPETKKSNQLHRPIGLGVQGWANALQKMRVPFDSEMAFHLNKYVWETMYHAALSASSELARVDGQTYPTFKGSPMHDGKFQFDLWDVPPPSDRWKALREKVARYGVRNSLLLSQMPTASTAQILGNSEACEPITSNVYTRRTLAGEFLVINESLIADLKREGLWDEKMKQAILRNKGSIQAIESIPQEYKDLYKTVWEIKQKVIIDQAADRAPFICQSQSMNLFMGKPTPNMVHSALFHGWKRGLKTGCYYLRTLPVADAVNVTTRHANEDRCTGCSG